MYHSQQQKRRPWKNRGQRRFILSAILIIMAGLSFTAGIFSDDPDEAPGVIVAQLSPTPTVLSQLPSFTPTETVAAQASPTPLPQFTTTLEPVRPTATNTPVLRLMPTAMPTPSPDAVDEATATAVPTATPVSATPQTALTDTMVITTSETPVFSATDTIGGAKISLSVSEAGYKYIEEIWLFYAIAGQDFASFEVVTSSEIAEAVLPPSEETEGESAAGAVDSGGAGSSASDTPPVEEQAVSDQQVGSTQTISGATEMQNNQPEILPATGLKYSPRNGYFMLSFILLLLAGGVIAAPDDRFGR